ncbi:MAG: carbamate kinase [Euryarchaeota archaeon]|nr:carbamate kinase [Euryarchaeota archaeon]|tara:strand:- start:2301 stop:3233 length:933 start_codon:yes stop_codon:yes gene_type:complete
MKPYRVRFITVTRTVVYAIGGNALSSPTGAGEKESALVLAKVMSDVIDLLEAGWRVILTHGNGPQVGHLMALDSSQPMDDWVAATQGMIGHTLSINLDSILSRRNRPEKTSVILTRVEVDPKDSGFQFPTKPVGPILTNEQVMSEDWDIAETINGPRRVVASPAPKEILDLEIIQSLIEKNAIVICCGGGGIPVIHRDGHYVGVPAVIDKDRLSALLAIEMQVDALIISTAIDAVRTGFGTPSEQKHHTMTVEQARIHLANEEFPAGSMGPKVASAIEVVETLEDVKSIICQPGEAIKALRGDSGTIFVK